MKRILKTILILVIILIFYLSMYASLAANLELGVSANQNNLNRENEVVISVSINGLGTLEKGINAFNGEIKYDETIFEPITQSSFAYNSPWTGLTYNEEEKALNILTTDFINTDQKMFTVKLKVKSDAKIGQTTVTFKNSFTTDNNLDIDLAEKSIVLSIAEQTIAESTNEKQTLEDKSVTTKQETTTTNNNIVNTTTAKPTKLPKAGKQTYIILGTLILLAGVAFIKYKKIEC